MNGNSKFSHYKIQNIKNVIPGWVVIMATSEKYNFHFYNDLESHQIEFEEITISSKTFNDGEKSITLISNHTEPRELFTINK